MEKIEDFGFDGWGLTQTKKGKAKHSEPLFMVYFSKAGTAKGKFMPEAVTALNLKPEPVKEGETKVHKTVNLLQREKGKEIHAFNSSATGEENTAKKTLSPNYIIELSAKEWKMLYDANGITEKEDCYFSMTKNMIEGFGTTYILQSTDIKVEKTERTAEQIKHSEELSTKLKKEHADFVEYAEHNGISFKGKTKYMAGFQEWKTDKEQEEAFRAYAKLNEIAIDSKILFDSHFEVWSKGQAKIKAVKKK